MSSTTPAQCSVTIVQTRNGKLQKRSLCVGGKLLIGKDTTNDFVIDNEGVSGCHAEIQFRDLSQNGRELLEIKDLSKNGTSVQPLIGGNWIPVQHGSANALGNGWKIIMPPWSFHEKWPLTVYVDDKLSASEVADIDGERCTSKELNEMQQVDEENDLLERMLEEETSARPKRSAKRKAARPPSSSTSSSSLRRRGSTRRAGKRRQQRGSRRARSSSDTSSSSLRRRRGVASRRSAAAAPAPAPIPKEPPPLLPPGVRASMPAPPPDDIPPPLPPDEPPPPPPDELQPPPPPDDNRARPPSRQTTSASAPGSLHASSWGSAGLPSAASSPMTSMQQGLTAGAGPWGAAAAPPNSMMGGYLGNMPQAATMPTHPSLALFSQYFGQVPPVAPPTLQYLRR